MDHSISCEERLNKPFCKPPEPEEQSKYVFTEKLHANNHNWNILSASVWHGIISVILLGGETHYYSMQIFQVIAQTF